MMEIPDQKASNNAAQGEAGESPARKAWAARLSAAVQIFLGLFIVFLMIDKEDPADGAAALAVLGVAALTILRPLGGESRRLAWIFVGALLVFTGMNLLAALLAEPLVARGSFHYRRMHIDGAAIAFAAGLGLRGKGSARRMLGVLLLVAGAWHLYEAVRLALWHLREASVLSWNLSSPYESGRLCGSRGFFVDLGNELVLLGALFMGWVFLDRNRWKQAAAFLAAGLAGFMILLTKTRGSMLAIAGIAAPASLLFQGRLGRMKHRIAAACLWTLVLLPAAGLVWYHLTSEDRKSPATINARLKTYRIAGQIVTGAPWHRALVGHGPSRRVFPAAARQYGTDSPDMLGDTQNHAHNVPLQILIESGLLSVAALAAIWLAALWAAWSAWRGRNGPASELAGAMLPALLAMAVVSMWEYTFLKTTGRLSWLVVGMAFAAGTFHEKAPDENLCLKTPDAGSLA